MIGTAFSVLVRLCVLYLIESKVLHHLVNMVTSSDLGRRESLRLNLAYPQKANKSVIHVSDPSQDVVPMVKVLLLESNPLVTSGEGLVQA
jgi:hypothetical protein